MKGLIKAGRFNIKFSRDYVTKTITVLDKKTNLKVQREVKSPINTCAVIFDDKGNAISSGMCSCYFKDNFTKEKGRIIALKRAIDLLSLLKEERTEIWKAYHER